MAIYVREEASFRESQLLIWGVNVEKKKRDADITFYRYTHKSFHDVVDHNR